MVKKSPIQTVVAVVFAIIGVSIFSIPLGADEGSEIDRSKRFSERDLRGPYGFSFNGFLSVPLPDGPALSVPISAVGQLRADGKGEVPKLVRTLNVGGLVILEQVSEGSYEVNPNGTGFAKFVVETVEQTGELPPGVNFPPMTIETFSFVINRPDREIQFIGRRILDADSLEPLGAGVIRGVARRQ